MTDVTYDALPRKPMKKGGDNMTKLDRIRGRLMRRR